VKRNEPINVAILGSGGWGKNLVRTFCSLVGEDHVVVVDPDRARRDAVAQRHPGVATAATPDWEAVAAAVIAAPAALHHDLAQQALENDLHVLVEKPIALKAADAKHLIALADERGRVLMVDHLLEYHPAVVHLKKLVDDGELGRILHLTSRRLNLGVIRTEENALWSLAPHDISIILYLLGQEPVTVSAHAATYLQPGIPDLAYVTMTFADQTLAHVHVSWLDPVKTRCLSIVGDAAMAVYDDMAADKLIVLQKSVVREGERFVPVKGEEHAVAISDQEPLRAMGEAFLASVRRGQTPRSDGRDGLRVVRILEAAQASADAGGQPVRLEGSDE